VFRITNPSIPDQRTEADLSGVIGRRYVERRFRPVVLLADTQSDRGPLPF